MQFIHFRTPYMIFGYLDIFWGNFKGHFWVFEFFKSVFGIKICDFVGVHLVKFIHFRAPYMISGHLVVFRELFLGIFFIFDIFKNV